MEIVKLLWVINIFFLVLILLFVWSKFLIISRKIISIKTIMNSMEEGDESENIADEDE
jgi:hypothetical protein